jgi:prevent-host-death family protein
MSKIIEKTDELFEIDVPVTEARAELATLIEKTVKHPVRITSHGKVKAVIVNPAFYERAMEALEDLEDIKAIEEYEQGPKEHISFEELKRELGF